MSAPRYCDVADATRLCGGSQVFEKLTVVFLLLDYICVVLDKNLGSQRKVCMVLRPESQWQGTQRNNPTPSASGWALTSQYVQQVEYTTSKAFSHPISRKSCISSVECPWPSTASDRFREYPALTLMFRSHVSGR